LVKRIGHEKSPAGTKILEILSRFFTNLKLILPECMVMP
jgi:hypothetical protein